MFLYHLRYSKTNTVAKRLKGAERGMSVHFFLMKMLVDHNDEYEEDTLKLNYLQPDFSSH